MSAQVTGERDLSGSCALTRRAATTERPKGPCGERLRGGASQQPARDPGLGPRARGLNPATHRSLGAIPPRPTACGVAWRRQVSTQDCPPAKTVKQRVV